MANDTSFTSDNQPQARPGRGKTFLNKMLDVIREESLIGASPDMGKDEAEKLYLGKFAERAFDVDDPASSALMGKILDKSYKTMKATMPEVEFEIPEGSSPVEKASAIMDAISSGQIPPDVGSALIGAAKSLIDIEMATDIKDRLEKLEQALEAQAK